MPVLCSGVSGVLRQCAKPVHQQALGLLSHQWREEGKLEEVKHLQVLSAGFTLSLRHTAVFPEAVTFYTGPLPVRMRRKVQWGKFMMH